MVKLQKYEKAYSLELLKVSQADLAAALMLAQGKFERVEVIFYQVQQALEKALKAVLISFEVSLPFTHDIETLTILLSQKIEVPFGDRWNSLTEFATIRRYLEGREFFEDQEIESILLGVKEALSWCDQQVKKNVAQKSN